MVAELELGATTDPRALVLGDPDALAVTGRRFAELAAAFGRTADGLARIEVGRWQGEAAEAFRSRFPAAVGQFSAAHGAFGHAASGWERYRQVVEWAQERAAEAVSRYQAALAASQVARDARDTDVARYNAAAGQGGGPAPLPPFVDPGPAGMAGARALLDEARARRDAVAAEVAELLRASAAVAPDVPSGPDAFLVDVGDLWRSRVDEAGRFLSGVAEGTEALVSAARSVNPLDPWNVARPAQYASGLSTAAAGVVTSAVHPLRLVEGLVGTGWGSDPQAAGGRAVPNLALALLPVGAASGRAAVERAAVRERVPAPRKDVGGGRDPAPAAAAVDDAVARRLRVLAQHRSITEALRPPASVDLPPGPPVPLRDAAGRPVVPAGFADRAAFEEFGRSVRDGVVAAGYDDVRVFVSGSAVSGVKYTTGVPFDLGRRSDFDVALASRELYSKAREEGIPVRGDQGRTRPLTPVDVSALGLTELQQRLSAAAGRKVEFMVYSTAGGATSRGASIEVGS